MAGMETWVDVDGRSQFRFVFAGCFSGEWWPSPSNLSFWFGGFLGFQYGLWVSFGFLLGVYGVVWSDLWFNAHILWIVGGLCSDLWFNSQIFRWWLSFFPLPDLVFGVVVGGLMVYAGMAVGGFCSFEVAGGGLHFHIFCHFKNLKIFYNKIFYL